MGLHWLHWLHWPRNDPCSVDDMHANGHQYYYFQVHCANGQPETLGRGRYDLLHVYWFAARNALLLPLFPFRINTSSPPLHIRIYRFNIFQLISPYAEDIHKPPLRGNGRVGGFLRVCARQVPEASRLSSVVRRKGHS
jgi:hypothetical protein